MTTIKYLPREIVLIRHGEAESNVANKRSRCGDNHDFTPDFLNRHSAQVRLTDKGKHQAVTTGKWLKENGLSKFDGYFVSEYTRAVETAALLDLPEASWNMDYQLRERDHGLVDVIPDSVRREKYGDYLRLRKLQLFYAPWPGGESMAEVCERLQNNVIATLREYCDKKVIIVSHGDIMRAFRVIFEEMTADEYHRIDTDDPLYFKIGNGQIVHYSSRIHPNDLLPYCTRPSLSWVRSVNPNEPSYGHDWQEISRRINKKYTNADLLSFAKREKRLVSE